MGCNSTKLPLLLERAGVRRVKIKHLDPPHPSLLLKGEGASICVNTYDSRGKKHVIRAAT